MNRRQFVKDSLITSMSGLATGSVVASRGAADPANPEGLTQPHAPTLKRRVYAHLLDPREHPDYTRRHVRPPSWDTFDGRTQFAALREFDIQGSRIVHYVEKIEEYTQRYELGDVLWMMYPILGAENLGDLADEIKRRKLFLFDIWGYVPVFDLGGNWQQLHPPKGVLDLLEAKLGERWLGMDNGEQDGRYIGGYSSQFYPASANKLEQYVNFHRFFERLTDDEGNKMSALVSLNFGHYFLKEGIYTIMGAETAQALPNGQVFYVFIRGAGKQYGVPWFGNASVFNRWGWKAYGPERSGDGQAGPTRGTSLSLMKRLMYSHILYNSMLVGFETSFFKCPVIDPQTGHCDGQELSPIGQIQRSAAKWVREVGQPGAMVTPIALMLDFFAGWTFPRHLYTRDVYRVWGNLPYAAGDYLTDGVLDMLYPGYQDSSYFHDESGFMTPTPYGDAADCVLSDAAGWLLARYPLLVIAGEVTGGAELRDKLAAYVTGGGHLLITAGNLAKFPDGLGGVQVKDGLKHFGPGAAVQVGEARVVEDSSFDVQALAFPKAARVPAESSGFPMVVEMDWGQGRITVLANPFGTPSNPKEAVFPGEDVDRHSEGVDQPLPKPYPLLKHVRSILDAAFRAQSLFEVGEGLSLIACRKGPGEYTLGIANNTWRQQALKITSHCGSIESLRELALDQAEKGALGYLPEGLEKTNLGVSDDAHVAGGDTRIYAVRVREEHVEEIPHRTPPARPRGRTLPLRDARPIHEQVLARPSFFEHFDSVTVDWRYLRQRDGKELHRERGWIGRQGLALYIDFTSGINLFPGLRLLGSPLHDDSASLAEIEEVMRKMEALSAHDLIFSLHRYPEGGHFTREQSWQSFEASVRQLCAQAAGRGITAHLRLSVEKPPESLKIAVEFAGRVGAPNLRLAPSTAFLLDKNTDLLEAGRLVEGNVGLWLVNTPQWDIAGRVWNENAPIRNYPDKQRLQGILRMVPQAPVIFDAVYENHEEEYLDAEFLRGIAGNSKT